MSLNAIAHHMASKGRGGDSMLVHMTPGEVAGLQALALKHGGSLTINPETGLVEAGFLDKLLPALAGFALNAFVPGLGTAIGGALGTSAAVGTGLAVGGFEALRTGSLGKGLSAGLGAYGGASLAGSMAGAGTSSLAGQAASAAGLEAEKAALAQGLSPETVAAMKAQAIEEAGNQAAFSNADKLSAGFSAAKEAPGAFLKDNWKYGLAAASPFIADAMVPTTTKMPTTSNQGIGAYIRPYDYDPVGQTFKRIDPIKVKDGGVVGYADGGDIDPYAQYNTLSGQSKAAYDYLMGNTASSVAPPVVGSQPPSTTQTPIFTSTQTPATTTTPTPTNPISPPPPTNPISLPPTFSEPEPVETDPYDQENQDAINKIEEEVAQEQYDQENQDAIDKYERELEQERYDQETQDAIDKYEREIAEETQYDRENQDAIDKIEREVEQERYDQEGQDAIDKYEREIAEETQYDRERQDAIDKYEREFDEKRADDFRTANDIDNATIGTPYDGYDSDFVPVNPSDFGAVDYDSDFAPANPSDFGGVGYDGGYCPAPWINILLADGGTVKAGDIKPGMEVYTRHETTNEWGAYPVSAVEMSEDERWEVLLEDGRSFVGSANHRVHTGEDWTEIHALKAGDKLVQPEGFGVVKSSAKLDHGAVVKITVADAHTYISEGFLSHNVKLISPTISDIDYSDYNSYDWDGWANGGLMGIRNSLPVGYNEMPSGNNQFLASGGIAGYATGGMSHLGGYSDGGRLLRGPGDGVSDSIPATIGKNRQPARLADGEFVVPARIVSELGNGSTEAGARKLYAMMDRIQKARGKTVGKGKVAANSRSDKHLPA